MTQSTATGRRPDDTAAELLTASPAVTHPRGRRAPGRGARPRTGRVGTIVVFLAPALVLFLLLVIVPIV
ncbi:hypothetical protein QEZ54_36290, partial [Catellatospora sp. KI3]|nr:hypothetical protein [Catellatospora sp. KI3]